MNLNKLMLAGNLTRDPDIRYTPKGTAVCEIGLAINDKRGEEQETTFVDITFWGDTAENVGKFFSKGDPIYVEGRLRMDQWEDKQTGQKRSKLKITAWNFQFLKPKGDRPQQPAASKSVAAKGMGVKAGPMPATTDHVANATEDDDDIPF